MDNPSSGSSSSSDDDEIKDKKPSQTNKNETKTKAKTKTKTKKRKATASASSVHTPSKPAVDCLYRCETDGEDLLVRITHVDTSEVFFACLSCMSHLFARVGHVYCRRSINKIVTWTAGTQC